MSLPAFGVKKPVVANLVMFALIGAGLVFGVSLRREFFPETNPTEVFVTAPYPGASPQEVEDSLAVKMEDRIDEAIDDIKEMNTVVAEGVAQIRIEFREGTDVDLRLFEVKREMDGLQDLPAEVETITVSKIEPNLPVIVVSIFGDANERDMKDAIRSVREDLRSLPGMGDILVSGVRTDEITVEVSPAALLEHGLSIVDVEDRIRAAMVELPAGAVRSTTQNVAIRTMGAAERADAVRRIVVKAGDDGQVLRVSDIAAVRAGFEDVDLVERLNGKPSVSLTVFKVGDEDAVTIAETVKAYVAGRNGVEIEPTTLERLGGALARMAQRPGAPEPGPPSVRLRAYELGASRTDPLPGELTTTTDLARFIVGRLDLLTRNALWGGLLVLIVLVALLNFRVAFWTAAGLVVSLMGTLAFMHFVGASLNLLTMFGLIIVLGLIVDDAIVVAENITARHEAGEPPLMAAIRGTEQVLWPVVATVLTTICAFLPLALIAGTIGDLLAALPIVVACALAVSLIEALLILPSHMGHSLSASDRAKRRRKRNPFVAVEAWMERRRAALFGRVLVPVYERSVRLALRFKYLSVVAAMALVVLSLGMLGGGRVPFNFLGVEDAETMNIELRMPIGTPAAQTDVMVRRIEAAALAQPEVSSAYASVGSIGSLEENSSSSNPHLGQVILELVPVERRDRSSDEVRFAIREALGELPGVKSLRIENVGGGPSGPGITLTVVGENIESLQAVGDGIKELLNEFEGVVDIADDNDTGRRELRITLRDAAKELGFTEAILARQIRGAVFGLEAHTFPGDREDVDVRVIYPESDRRSLAELESMWVFSARGVAAPLSEVAAVEETEGYATIRRLDRRRAVTVSADVDQSRTNTEEVVGSLMPRIEEMLREYPGVEVLERGRQKDVADSFATLPLGMGVAAALIFVVLAWLFQSYTQPVIVMMAIPFATIGMIWGHFLMGFDMTILSLIGFIALSGVVVNDSLIFMEFFRHKRSEGMPVFDACVAAGCARLRAILLTTLTTVFGLLPLLTEQSLQARFLIPMAITISFGLISATAIILIVLPCLLLIYEDVKGGLRWVVTGSWSGGDGGGGR
ncbi:MAG: efflux RND transporter permease subunit [Phycisphaerales bacterium]